MQRASRAAQRFVRALLTAGEARLQPDGTFHVGTSSVRLPASEVAKLVGAGVLGGDRQACRACTGTATWLRRQLLSGGEAAGQHREEARQKDGTTIDLAESPLARLATIAAGETTPFLARHQVEAGERFRRLFERAQLRGRVTMTYDASRIGRSGGNGSGDIADMAADARRELSRVMTQLPADCAGVIFDICGMEKGLQQVEQEREWPRRSAKLVLRIGLDQLARHFGLTEAAVGREKGPLQAWMDEGARPMEVG
jgi:hypothetical protein